MPSNSSKITRTLLKTTRRSFSIKKIDDFSINNLEKRYKSNFIINDLSIDTVTDVNLKDEDVMKRLIRGPLPVHLLKDSKYFSDVVNRGNHKLCSQLLRNGQKIQLIDDEGNNLLVRIIERNMGHLIGVLMTTNHDQTMLALNLKDNKTGHTPFSKAVELSDRIALFEIVDPRPQS